MVIPEYLKVYLAYLVDEVYHIIIVFYVLYRDGKLLFVQEYHVYGLPGAMGQIRIRPMENGILLTFAYAYRCAADIAAPYY